MGLEDVLEDIKNTTQKEVHEIEVNAFAEKKRILSRAREKVALAEKRLEQDIADASVSMKKREVAAAKIEGKRLHLNARKKIVDKAYAMLREKLSSLDREERAKILSKLVESAILEVEPAYAYVLKEDTELVKKLVPKVKCIETTGILGGVILENADGSVRVNKSFDSILDEMKSSSLKELSEVIFD
ncbi:MAG: hypothetical protein J7K00_02455 [Candidatus Diapherotrites archaeon]|nr:hypothetical protein [Candidatus Diapherotrites archaeon]